MELTLNRSLLDSKSILFKSSFFYRGYNGDTTAEDISLIDDFDFNRDFTLDKLFLEFNKLDNDSIVSVGVGRTEIDQFSPLYKVDGIAVKLRSTAIGTNFNFIIGKNQNYNFDKKKMNLDSLNFVAGISNNSSGMIDNNKNVLLEYEFNYSRMSNYLLQEKTNYISSIIRNYDQGLYQVNTSFEYDFSNGISFINFGGSLLSKKLPQVSLNYSFIDYITDDYGDTTLISETNFHNIRVAYKRNFISNQRSSLRVYFDLQTGDFESRAITGILKEEKFLFNSDITFKAKFGISENYNLINLGLTSERALSKFNNLFLSFGVDIYGYLTETGGDVSFAPNIFIFGKNLFKVENLSYKLYLRETVYPKSFFRKLLFKLEINYEIY